MPVISVSGDSKNDSNNLKSPKNSKIQYDDNLLSIIDNRNKLNDFIRNTYKVRVKFRVDNIG
jgi:hypothetical protein